MYKNHLYFHILANTTLPFNSGIKKNKILRNKFNQRSIILYTKNYITSLKEIKDPNKGKNFPCLWLRRLNVVKMTIVPKLIYRQTNPKIGMEMQGPTIEKTMLRKNKVGGSTSQLKNLL